MKRIASVEKPIDADGVNGYAILGDGRLPKPVILRPEWSPSAMASPRRWSRT